MIIAFSVGDRVQTTNGDRKRGCRWVGTIIGWAKWRDYEAAVVEKDTAWDTYIKPKTKVTCLLKNLVHVKDGGNK